MATKRKVVFMGEPFGVKVWIVLGETMYEKYAEKGKHS
jgi:hypothetical protein